MHGIHIQYYPDIQVSQVKRDFEKTALLGTIHASTSFESSAALKTQTHSSNVSSAIAARKSSRLLKAWHRMAKSFKSHLVIPSITSLLRAVCWNYTTSHHRPKSSPPQIGSAARLPVQLGHREIDNPQICQYTISSIEQKHVKMCAMITHIQGGRAIFQHSNTQIPHAHKCFVK